MNLLLVSDRECYIVFEACWVTGKSGFVTVIAGGVLRRT